MLSIKAPKALKNRATLAMKSDCVVIGLDPGIDTGAARYEDGKLVALSTLCPYQVHDYLQGVAPRPVLVVLEDSRKTNEIFSGGDLPIKAKLKVARNVGEIDGQCRDIEQICKKLGLRLQCVSPLEKGKKHGPDAFRRVTQWDARTNQHERDAAMVAWPYRKGVV